MTISPRAMSALLDETIAALLRERDHVMKGDFDALIAEGEKREARIAKLEEVAPPLPEALREKVERIRAEAERNAGLLKAAIDGAGAGRQRIVEMLAARDRLTSYDAAGRAVERSTSTRLEKRF